MLQVSETIKQAYTRNTTQRKSYIQVGNDSFFIQNLDIQADCYDEGNVVGSAIAKICKFDIETELVHRLKEFEVFDGIWTGNQYEYVSLGTFELTEEQGADDFFSSVTAYDKLIKFNKIYNPLLTTYPTTINGLFENICEQAGVEVFEFNLVNGEQTIEKNLFIENETLKMILKAICQVNGVYSVISQDKLKLLLESEEITFLNKNQVADMEFKRTTWKINQVILGMKDVVGEHVIRQDDDDVEQNGIHKIVINDNPFTYTQDLRDAYIDNLFNKLNGFGYTAFEGKWESLPYHELGDRLNIDGHETILLRYTMKSPNGLESDFSAPSIINSAIDYKNNADNIANRQARTEFLVKKNEQEIRAEIEATNGNVASLKLDNESVVQQVTSLSDNYKNLDQEIDSQNKDLNKKIEANTALIKLTAESITSAVQKSGGNNKIRNSVGLKGNEFWTLSEDANLTSSQDTETEQTTTSGSKFILSNGSARADFSTIIDTLYSIAFKISKTSLGIADNVSVELHRSETDYDVIYEGNSDVERWEEISYSYTATVNAPYLVFKSNGDVLEFSDLIVSEGEVQTWSQHSDEVYGKTQQLDSSGLSLSSLSTNETSKLNNNNLTFKEGSNITAELSKERILSNSAEIKERMKIRSLSIDAVDEDNYIIY